MGKFGNRHVNLRGFSAHFHENGQKTQEISVISLGYAQKKLPDPAAP